jgi:hypothetical protein
VENHIGVITLPQVLRETPESNAPIPGHFPANSSQDFCPQYASFLAN